MLYQPVPPFVNSLNYAFIGESGCGKSELAINLAYRLHSCGKEVHLFDLDQTKPLFRSRDLKERLLQDGIRFHYEEQYYDTPTSPEASHGSLRRRTAAASWIWAEMIPEAA